LKPNDLGLFDMLGNAWEWCFDRYSDYPEQKDRLSEDRPTTQPIGTGEFRVLRGGAFLNPPVSVRSARRGDYLPDNRYTVIGFRPARTYP
jgi:formylglycine-generating enzyme required for sulfatase activity